MFTIINNETDPLYNLALEEYVYKHLDIKEDILLIWQNRDSVVIGKDKNPFRDVNFTYTHNNKIPVFRRLTDGETIFHDLGTVNYSYIVKGVKEKQSNFIFLLESIQKFLKDLGVVTTIHESGDLCMEGFRVSANTQTFNRNRLLYHGVLFFNTNLEKLDLALDAPELNEFEFDKVRVKHKGITNIKDYLPKDLSVNQFKKLLLHNIIGEDLRDNEYLLDYTDKTRIKKIAKEKYNSWEWNYGKSPDFIIKKEYDKRMMITLIVKEGVIDRVSIDSYENVRKLVKGLEGSRFNELDLKENLRDCTSVDVDVLINTLLY